MNEARVVLDTNLFVSILLRSQSLAPLAELIRNGKVRVIISTAQIAELAEVLQRPRFNFPPSDVKALFDWIRLEAILVTPAKINVPISRDPKDDFLIATAIAGDANAIVTGDKDLLILSSYAGIPILSPRKFLDETEEGERKGGERGKGELGARLYAHRVVWYSLSAMKRKWETINDIRKRFKRRREWFLIQVAKMDEATTTPLTGRLLAQQPRQRFDLQEVPFLSRFDFYRALQRETFRRLCRRVLKQEGLRQ